MSTTAPVLHVVKDYRTAAEAYGMRPNRTLPDGSPVLSVRSLSAGGARGRTYSGWKLLGAPLLTERAREELDGIDAIAAIAEALGLSGVRR